MRETDDRTADIEDLLYDEDEGYPSERWMQPGKCPVFSLFFATIFQLLLYTLPRFGYNITDNGNL